VIVGGGIAEHDQSLDRAALRRMAPRPAGLIANTVKAVVRRVRSGIRVGQQVVGVAA
jgi:hypothetical protein